MSANQIPKVLLAGDSISFGYGPLVKKLLDGTFQVENLPQNGGSSARLLANLDDWLIRPGFDIIHVNCGIHDLIQGGGAPIPIPLETYEANLEKIVDRLKRETSSILIWATTTPIIDELLNTGELTYQGREQDIVRYNDAATRIMTRHGIPINDLHKLIEDGGKEQCISADGIHMSDFGCELQARAIADTIRRVNPP